jgi:ABC-type glutathione transport system ATPase component
MPRPAAVQDSPAAHRGARTAPVAGLRPGSREQDSETVARQLREVHKSVGSLRAVQGVDLSIRSGEVLTFLGPNATGKTSTIDTIRVFPSRPSGPRLSRLIRPARHGTRRKRRLCLCMDEKSETQALDHTQRPLPSEPGPLRVGTATWLSRIV